MVKKTKTLYSYSDWQRDNPVEADIHALFNAAHLFALSQVPHVGGASGDPEDPPERFDETPTQLEASIQRAESAIRAMLKTSAGRKAAGLPRKGRGKDKSYDPDSTSPSDPQVLMVLAMLRGEVEAETAYSEISKMISPNETIDKRTLAAYVNDLTWMWGSPSTNGAFHVCKHYSGERMSTSGFYWRYTVFGVISDPDFTSSFYVGTRNPIHSPHGVEGVLKSYGLIDLNNSFVFGTEACDGYARPFGEPDAEDWYWDADQAEDGLFQAMKRMGLINANGSIVLLQP